MNPWSVRSEWYALCWGFTVAVGLFTVIGVFAK